MRLIHATAVCAMALFLHACSDGNGSTTTQRSGQFLDAGPVQGLNFQTDTMSGATDADGTFEYSSGESIVFSIGSIELPSVPAAPIVTALDVFDTDELTNTSVVNLNRLLQSLDANANPDDGIDLTTLDTANTQGLEIDFASADFDTQVVNLVANNGGDTVELVSSTEAEESFDETLTDNGLGASGCTADHPLVGASAEFTTRFHDVVGTLSVVDDCTLRVTGFGYDGLGPRVSFYTGLDGIFSGPNARPIGPRLNGQVYIDDEFTTLTLPEDLTLDDVNSLSVWCIEFRISFGDAVLTPES